MPVLRCLRTVLLAIGVVVPALASAQTHEELKQDFDTAWRAASARYAYFDAKATSWADVPKLYGDDLQRLSTRDDLVALLERVLDELYDTHAQLNVNLANSPRLVPSGTDLWAEWRRGEATITDVRADSDARRAGIRPGDVVVSMDTVPIAHAVEARLGRSYAHSVSAARDWALRAVLAGRHGAPRQLQVRQGNQVRTFELSARDPSGQRDAAPVSQSRVAAGIGYVRFNDSLGDEATIRAFDRALDDLGDTRALILDLRNTPSGGNSVVARGILGRFVTRDLPYQRHVLPSEERDTGIRRSWLELVSPRGSSAYRRPVAVLVGHWTGSMGEGLAIGFDATRSATVVGTAMAGLLGATDPIVLPHTGIALNLPTERLYHVNGTPRETFRPGVLVDVAHSDSHGDPFVEAALRVLRQPGHRGPAKQARHPQ
ncbi:S41 family peptidase [Piscinibacter sp. XHJ-5]|uniref:S41 family peptidase n=1 Tax=Piscinibacter sp. XHJ-5 TaxID=3037797 RepID=UPI002452C693|nr:S41 family peptidase [Piscinibacter sp. XHJ-5]